MLSAEWTRSSKVPSRKPCTASRSESEADSSQSLNSSAYKPREDMPSRLKLATYPDVTICRSSTTIYIILCPALVIKCVLRIFHAANDLFTELTLVLRLCPRDIIRPCLGQYVNKGSALEVMV